MSYKFSDKEINELLKGLVIVTDTRESKNLHVLEYFTERNIEYVVQKVDTGDYNAYIKSNPELGILRDLYIPSVVERKAHIDEICGNLQKSTQAAFTNELIRSKDIPFTILVEDKMGYEKMVNGNYRSKYDPKALLGRLNGFKAKYNFEIVYIDSRYSGNWIYYHLYYQAREYLKNL